MHFIVPVHGWIRVDTSSSVGLEGYRLLESPEPLSGFDDGLSPHCFKPYMMTNIQSLYPNPGWDVPLFPVPVDGKRDASALGDDFDFITDGVSRMVDGIDQFIQTSEPRQTPERANHLRRGAGPLT